MKKLFLVIVFLLFSQAFISCTNDLEDDLILEQTNQSDNDWGGDDVDDEKDDEN